MTSPLIAASNRSRGRLLLLAGLGLAALGVVAYGVQFSLRRLFVPWYMPGLTLLGAGLVAASLRKRRTVPRALGFVAVVLLAGAELAVLDAMRLPRYAGPVAVGRPFPAFESRRADGTPFTQADLAGDRPSVLVFFRGRW
ncbi:MAG TPA: hypothetical protein VG406_08955 [Isosphaeraceae bacterium]|jgi:hypothetical protein|nr:hypothetical protein [Isosphaeraceae bacterium]